MGDYSYVVHDAQIIYATIGKFCSIASHSFTSDRSCQTASSSTLNIAKGGQAGSLLTEG